MSMEGLEWLKERSLSEDRLNRVRQLDKVAKDLGTTLAKMGVAWCLKNPNVSSVILGASKVSQIEENLMALEVIPLMTQKVMDEIEGILENKPEVPAF